ncbi:unnamed protein product [Anisakis simplex]|uniref:Secreted protein n=1 Tax=Anisakis simplex TaxID=6269 RepID=A0A0M3JRE4_ANISI|nr:unnamed protein product [Anisakis simplex]
MLRLGLKLRLRLSPSLSVTVLLSVRTFAVAAKDYTGTVSKFSLAALKQHLYGYIYIKAQVSFEGHNCKHTHAQKHYG